MIQKKVKTPPKAQRFEDKKAPMFTFEKLVSVIIYQLLYSNEYTEYVSRG